MGEYESRKHREWREHVPDTRNYEGRHSKGCAIVGFMLGLIAASPFAGAAYAIWG